MFGKSFLLSLLLVFYGAGTEAALQPTILVLGDSLSAGYGIDVAQGWVTLLQERLQEQGFRHKVVNASVSGETSDGGRARLPGLLKRYSPQIIILELGANDGLRGQSVELLNTNLEQMTRAARSSNSQLLLVGIRVPTSMGQAYNAQFVKVFNQVSTKLDVPLVPFLLDGVFDKPELVQEDGLHPKAEAQPRTLENVWKYLRPMLQ